MKKILGNNLENWDQERFQKIVTKIQNLYNFDITIRKIEKKNNKVQSEVIGAKRCSYLCLYILLYNHFIF